MNTSRAMKPCTNAPPGSFQGHSARPWKRNFAAAIGAGRRKGSRQQVEPRTARCALQNNRVQTRLPAASKAILPGLGSGTLRRPLEPDAAKARGSEWNRAPRGKRNRALLDGGQMVSIKVFSTRVNNSTPSRKTKIVSAMEIAQ